MIGCAADETNKANTEISNSDPVTWVTIEDTNYYYSSYHDSMDESTLIDTETVTGTDDGIQYGRKIFKSTVLKNSYFIKSPDHEGAWLEYRIRE
ncbi:hypothetical protein [Paenibacillus monticola]|uniref:Uncharacterized protein n=1 Tax=Paenibacillus monticola TaxID=2666075 RepID=A0A7X2H529_9BACL|nr:hypothetical protein [Paenibacillus monticola]MRN53744.1 hypothetical protein [Paenibacillus monticola]